MKSVFFYSWHLGIVFKCYFLWKRGEYRAQGVDYFPTLTTPSLRPRIRSSRPHDKEIWHFIWLDISVRRVAIVREGGDGWILDEGRFTVGSWHFHVQASKIYIYRIHCSAGPLIMQTMETKVITVKLSTNKSKFNQKNGSCLTIFVPGKGFRMDDFLFCFFKERNSFMNFFRTSLSNVPLHRKFYTLVL